MEKAIWRYLGQRAGKTPNRLTCPVAERMIEEQAAAGSSQEICCHTRLQKAPQHAYRSAAKRKRGPFPLASRLVVLVMSLCLSWLLTLAVQAVAPSTALAGAPETEKDISYYEEGFCLSFTRDEVPPEWKNEVCDAGSESEFSRGTSGSCRKNWVKRMDGAKMKCVLTVPALRLLCPIGFALNKARCVYIPKKTNEGWQFPCSDSGSSKPNEGAIAKDWLSGDGPSTPTSISSDPPSSTETKGGRFVHTFAADTYELDGVTKLFGYMLGLSFLMVTPVILLLGYQVMLAASSFRHAGALEGLSRVLLGIIAVGVSFQLVVMLITLANLVSGAIVALHGAVGYPQAGSGETSAAYTLANEPATSYRGIVVPMSRWGCTLNRFIGIFAEELLSDALASWIPVIGSLSHLATKVTTAADLLKRLMEFVILVLSVILWVQVVIRLALLNGYILTSPLAFASWALPGGVGQNVVYQWTTGFLSILFLQVVQLFVITIMPLILPSFPAIAADSQDIMQVLLSQLPLVLVLWLTVRVPKLLGIGAGRAIGRAGLMAGGMVTAVGAATWRWM